MYFQVIINSFSGFGPYCLSFDKNEPCTIYDLKKRLSQTTMFSIEEQRIRSLGGRILTDSVNLLQDYSIEEGPIILNLTVSLVGGRNNISLSEDNTTTAEKKKKLKVDKEKEVTRESSPIQQQQIRCKGKEKESRKRKLE